MDFVAASLENQTAFTELIYRFAVACVLAGLIGFNREWREKPAGLKTHIMVAVAACAFAILSLEIFADAVRTTDESQADPIRVVEAVVQGVAFLGAGAIIQARTSVRGVTTGASIWVAGAIGLAAGTGHVAVALLCTGFGLVVLIGVQWFERHALERLRPSRENHETEARDG